MRPAPPTPSRHSWLVDAGCLAVLLVMGWKLLHGLERAVDLGMWDEADYLRRGLTLSWAHLPAAEWGPLYSIWYSVLEGLWPAPVTLYYANHQLLCILTTVGGYVFMRRMGARPVLALLGSALYLLSSAPHILPRPTLLALLVLQVALVVASFLAVEGFWAVIAGGLLLASFARPEFFVAFLLATVLFVGFLVRRVLREGRASRARGAALAVGFAVWVVVLLQVLGNPFGDTQGRRFYAFCQHFAVNHVKHTHGSVDPWNECPRVIRSVFGEVDTVGEALRSNPGAFVWHVGLNVKAFAGASLALFSQGPGGQGPWDLARMGRLLLLLAMGWQGARLLPRWRGWRSVLAEPGLQRMAGVLAIVEVPTVMSAVLLMPRAHYLVIQGVLVIALLALLGARVDTGETSRPVGWALGGLLALGLVVLTPGTKDAQPELVHLRTVRAIAALGLEERLAPGERVHLLEARGGYDAYLGRRYFPVLREAREKTFGGLLREHQVTAILLDDALRQHRRFRQDADFQAFLKDPEAFGFTLTPLASSDAVLALPSSWAPRLRAVHPE
ncbi:MAG TPA: hypothetical protein VF794_09825 [Archangium sp.]|uniref:hypothetical protein n=1 Tax=Archangium sp. TaxID=1872627 RepID=UPI002ED9CCFB